jgi:hypothetical protein
MSLAKNIGAIVAGHLFWAAIGSLLILVLRLTWPAYEAAHPTRNFTFPMLLVRLVIGAAATLGAGALVRRMAGIDSRTVLIFACLLLLVNLFVHLREPTWSTYPGWFHLVFLGYLLPLTLLGGRAIVTHRSNHA